MTVSPFDHPSGPPLAADSAFAPQQPDGVPSDADTDPQQVADEFRALLAGMDPDQLDRALEALKDLVELNSQSWPRRR